MTAPSSARRVLRAPVSGWLVAIDEVPDAVFAGRMVGDGVAIDPTGSTIVAPCDGTVTMLHPSRHAVTIRTPDGIDVLIHVGLDTVTLKGEGFTPRVESGSAVAAGAPLIDFDADRVAQGARSLLTQVVIASMDGVSSIETRSGSIALGDVILEYVLSEQSGERAGPTASIDVVSDPIVVPNPTGLHARPAALLARAAKGYRSDVRVRSPKGEANAKSVVSLMALEIDAEESVRIVASGTDADEAVASLAQLVAAGLGEDCSAPSESAPPAGAVDDSRELPDSGGESELRGVPASPGWAVGRIVQVRRAEPELVENATDPRAEHAAFARALRVAVTELDELVRRLSAGRDPAKAAIFAAHAEMLDDPELLGEVGAHIERGRTAAFAVDRSVKARASRLEALRNELLAARANDLRDAGLRVVRILAGTAGPALSVPKGSILVAEDLSPSDTANLDRRRVVGFCTTHGGATSHVAILARSLDIPAIAGIDPRALDLPDGLEVVLDGTRGAVLTAPKPEDVARAHERRREREAQRTADLGRASEPAETTDGHRVEVAANVGSAAEAESIAAAGGDGIGLLRSEFLFLDRTTPPSEDEQAEAYSAVVAAVGSDRPVIIRTLDVGGDKQLAYLPIPAEDNPFLGVRGIRVGLGQPGLLRAQVRAILRASARGAVRIMFPMIGSVSELEAARRIVEEERERLAVPPVPVGIMIEVPAAAIAADRLAHHADFFSIGTNDLTQYTLAVDRGHPTLAPMVDGLHPAVLALIEHTVLAAHDAGRWAGVCGGIAADPQAVPILLGLGVDELSVAIPAIPAVKAQVRTLTHSECVELAGRALRCSSPDEVRALTGGASGR